jgi:hypothetical protein
VISMKISCWHCFFFFFLEQIEARRVQSLADSLAMVTTVSGVKGQREIK